MRRSGLRPAVRLGVRLGLLLVLGGLGGLGGARSAQAEDAPPASAPAESALERGLGALRVRLEAKLKEAELLEKQGRLEEALAVTRTVERLYQEGLAELRLLLGLPADSASGAVPGGRSRHPYVVAPPVLVPRAPRPPVSAPLPEELRPAPPAASPEGARRPQHDPQQTAAAAVPKALRWLAAHQSEGGGWEAAGFDRWCEGKPSAGERPDGVGRDAYDIGVTGLAVCAFLGAGYTHRGDHEFARVVRKGLAYLKNGQDPEGCFGGRSAPHDIYNHALAALAMVEAYGMTGSPIYKGAAQRALDFIALARNPYAVWRYGVKPGDNDTSVTGWMALVLESARRINAEAAQQGLPEPLTVDREAFDAVRTWLDRMTDPATGRVGYLQRGGGVARPAERVDRFPAEQSEAMTAVGVALRVLCLGEDARASAPVTQGLERMLALPPVWNPTDGRIDMVYWYFGTLGCFQAGGDAWKRWRPALTRAAAGAQRLDGAPCTYLGSWDPLDPWGPEGGRVYATALMTLCCEVAARAEAAEAVPGAAVPGDTVPGERDAAPGAPLPGR